MSPDLSAEIQVAANASAATWLTDRLWQWPTSDGHVLAGSIVPEGFPAYAAIRYESGVEDALSDREAQALLEVLSAFTDTPDLCWYCLWTGYGGLDVDGLDHALVRQTQREYLLLCGPLAAVLGFDHLRPQFWWPDDGRWCFATDMDFARCFVGGPDALVEVLDKREELDAERIPLEVRVDLTNHLFRLVQSRAG